jgi:hypothetical protein
MLDIITVGLDLAKNVFQVHGADGIGQAVLRKKLQRTQILEFSANFRDASLRWKLVGALISGAVR